MDPVVAGALVEADPGDSAIALGLEENAQFDRAGVVGGRRLRAAALSHRVAGVAPAATAVVNDHVVGAAMALRQCPLPGPTP